VLLRENSGKPLPFNHFPSNIDLPSSPTSSSNELLHDGINFMKIYLFPVVYTNMSDEKKMRISKNRLNETTPSLSLRKLRSLAKEHGLKGYYKLKKADLIELIQQSKSSFHDSTRVEYP